MRASQLLLATMKETPADADIASHRLMLRAGMVRQLASGLYSWLPLGVRVLRKVEAIVREEMNRAGAQEVLMPSIQPAELWQESGRWDHFGPDLLRLKDRHDRDFCIGPTHEEVITDIARREIRSYKQLPCNFYQIQTKFRDEVRPRFGVMRAREFIMKDAYSFDIDQAGHDASYGRMRDAYVRIFTRMGLDFRVVAADSGAIGGAMSHEFQVLADSGEDAIAFSSDGDYAANVELAALPSPTAPRPPAGADLQTIDTPDVHTMAELAEFVSMPLSSCLKTLVLEGADGGLVMLVLRGDHDLNFVKAASLPEVATPVSFASAARIAQVLGCEPGSLGPVGVKVPVIADQAAALLADFVCGANVDGRHLTGVNWERDLPAPRSADLRSAQSGDPAPDGSGTLSVARGIEVGHIFQLGTKYSESMHAVCLDDGGKAVSLIMGCYGIGVTRIPAAAIEQNHDEKGIVWPTALAPFHVALLPMNMHKSRRLQDAVGRLHDELEAAGVEVLLDDRNVRPGVMFAESELLGIPHRLVLGERGLDDGIVEYKDRRGTRSENLPIAEAVQVLRKMVDEEIDVA